MLMCSMQPILQRGTASEFVPLMSDVLIQKKRNQDISEKTPGCATVRGDGHMYTVHVLP